MSFCILAGGKTLVFAAAAFTLSWTHSVEKIGWTEHWRVTPAGLRVVEARVEGSGAGMDPPEGSIFRDGGWDYRPHVPAQPRLILASSGATVGGWKLCPAGKPCLMLGSGEGDAITIEPCGDDGQGGKLGDNP
jgi:hypothetical protein